MSASTTDTRALPQGRLDLAARRSMMGPTLLGLILTLGALIVGPWPLSHRLVLIVCVLAGGGFIVAEYSVRWEQLPTAVYLPLPALGLIDIGAGMWATGGWTSPFIAFLALPTAYAVTATTVRAAVPVAVLAGVISASPALYTPHSSFLLVLLGAVPAYCTLVLMVGAIMGHLRRTDRLAQVEHEARELSEVRTRDLLTLQRVSGIVAAHLSMDEALGAIVRELSDAFGHSLISVYLRQNGQLVMQAQIGYTTYYETIGIGEGVIGTAYERDQTIFIPDVRIDPAYREAVDAVVSEIAIPLRDESTVIGVLNVESREQFGDRDRDLMELFGAQVSVVLRNARLASELRVRAERDSLTGLLNHRALVETLDATLHVLSASCAVLMIDLDDFKRVNDTYGHLIGDAMLRHLAEILTHSFREQDVFGRYGGDEFVVILPNVDRPHAQLLADRVAASASARPYHIAEGTVVPIALSIGVAVAPEDGSTRQLLLAHADAAMYRAKARHMGTGRERGMVRALSG